MTVSTEAASLLAIDIGTITTRAYLFDAVNGVYRFIAVGTSPSTYRPPMSNSSEGVRQALDNLEEITGRQFINVDERLIIPSESDSVGIDLFTATVSSVTPLRVITIGLLEDVSLESAENLAKTTYARVVDSISMNDRRKLGAKLDAIINARADLIIVAGGTEAGASKSVLKLIDPISLACYLMPPSQRPAVLYAGNPAVAEEVETTLAEFTTVYTAPNVRPTLEQEQLGPAHGTIRQIFRDIYSDTNPGLQELNSWSSGRLMPSATGYGRMIRFIDQYHRGRPALGVDLGAASTNVSASFDNGDLYQKIYSSFGMGEPIANVLNRTTMANIARWVPYDITPGEIRDYLLFKERVPQGIPVTDQDLQLEYAIAREIIRAALKDASKQYPRTAERIRSDLLPTFEPIVVSGSTITNAPSLGYAMLLILDAIEPVGITKVLLDKNNLMSVLGASAEINPLLPVQVFDNGGLMDLATVIAPVTKARFGTPVLRVSIGNNHTDVNQGDLKRIPVPPGRKVQLQLRNLHRSTDLGVENRSVEVVAGELGVVIDARGRAINLSNDPARRQDLLKKWIWTMKS